MANLPTLNIQLLEMPLVGVLFSVNLDRSIVSKKIGNITSAITHVLSLRNSSTSLYNYFWAALYWYEEWAAE